MKRLTLAGASLAIVLFATQFAQADEVDDYIKSHMKQHRIPGVALEIIRDGQAVKTAGYGVANLELNVPVSLETVFEIGSITKQFTAAGILLLAQEGRLSVDDKISKYLKDTPEAWRRVTIRHLLTHTSGIKSYTGLDGFQLWRHLTQGRFIQAIGAQPIEFQPGESWKYCNTGFNLLGYIIENVSGINYWDFMSRRIFHPLGMQATANRLPSLVIPHRADGYERTNHAWINRDYDLTDVFSAGAIVSTVGDLAKWAMSLDGEGLLNAASKAQMWTPVRLNDGNTTNYGFGWHLGEVEGHKNIGHSGSTSGFSSSIQRFPDDKLAVIVLSNTDEEIATILARKIATFCFKISSQPEAAKPASHGTRNLEGWQVYVDDRLLGGPDAELGQRALRLLADRLYEITLEMQSDRLQRLQQVSIWLDRTHGNLTTMQYHPNPVWLSEHGYSTNLAKCVHIPDAALFASPRDHFRQPWAVLHELAHAYHDQVLGFDHPEIIAAWDRFGESRRYESVLQIDGRMEKHYGLTDPKEFFAEMSEAYFGMNDFFPFNRAELKREEPRLFSLLLKIWGPLPSSITSDAPPTARNLKN